MSAPSCRQLGVARAFRPFVPDRLRSLYPKVELIITGMHSKQEIPGAGPGVGQLLR